MDYRKLIADIDAQIGKLQMARNALARVSERASTGTRGGRRKLSAAARARIAAAQKARWAKWRKGKGKAA